MGLDVDVSAVVEGDSCVVPLVAKVFEWLVAVVLKADDGKDAFGAREGACKLALPPAPVTRSNVPLPNVPFPVVLVALASTSARLPLRKGSSRSVRYLANPCGRRQNQTGINNNARHLSLLKRPFTQQDSTSPQCKTIWHNVT